nr:kynurenine formamidase [Onthophagus taurus]
MMSKEIERRFSPSFWTSRYSQEDAVNKYIEVSTKIGEEILKEQIPCSLNITYGGKEREKFDLFGTDLPDDAPILIFIHGGYWQYEVVTKNTSRYPVKSLYKNGIKTIIIGYTLSPECMVEEIIKNVSFALNKCFSYAFEKGSRCVGISGHSAGAQISIISMISLFKTLKQNQKKIFKGFFLLGGIYNLEEILETSYNDVLKLNKNKAKELSPIFQSYDDFNDEIKFFICVGTEDCPGFIDQSKQIYDLLKNGGKSTELITIKGIDHYNITENLHDENFEIIKIIKANLI